MSVVQNKRGTTRLGGVMLNLMCDQIARTADRHEAAKWLGDRGFGRSIQGLDISQRLALDIRRLSTEDLEALVAILDKYDPSVAELAGSGEIPFAAGGSKGA